MLLPPTVILSGKRYTVPGLATNQYISFTRARLAVLGGIRRY